MRVRMKTIMAGPNISASLGQIIDIPRPFAYDLIESGAAEQVDDDPVTRVALETATIDPPEAAVILPVRNRKGR